MIAADALRDGTALLVVALIAALSTAVAGAVVNERRKQREGTHHPYLHNPRAEFWRNERPRRD